MRRLAFAMLAITAFGALIGPVSPAHAESSFQGRCDFVTTGTVERTGYVYAAVAVFSNANGQENPVSATVTCYLSLNGDYFPVATFSGTGVIVGAEPLEFTYPGGWIFVCTEVDFTSNDDPTQLYCSPDDDPPPSSVDGLVCLVLKALRPIPGLIPIPGWIEIDPSGDLRIVGALIWDCPPYA